MNQQNQVKDNSSNNKNNNNDNTQSEILEQGDIYFFYRPKKGAEEVKGIEDIRRFFMVTAPEEEENNNKSRLYRLFIIGKKSLPEVRKTEARASERYWARVAAFLKNLMSLQENSSQMSLGKVTQQDQLGRESMQ